jgi:hypothetical protein
MAIANVVKIEFNIKMKDKFDGAYLHSQTSSGQKRKDFIFQKSDMFPVLRELSVGDEIDLKIVKEGEYWNLKDIKPTGNKQAASTAPITSASATTKASSSGSGWQPRYSDSEEYTKHKDLMIIKQSSLKTASDLVIAMLNKDMFKKTATADFIVQETLRIQQMFQADITGVASGKALEASVTSLDKTGSVEYDDDNPFPE